jgi:hypothetical protein
VQTIGLQTCIDRDSDDISEYYHTKSVIVDQSGPIVNPLTEFKYPRLHQYLKSEDATGPPATLEPGLVEEFKRGYNDVETIVQQANTDLNQL